MIWCGSGWRLEQFSARSSSLLVGQFLGLLQMVRSKFTAALGNCVMKRKWDEQTEWTCWVSRISWWIFQDDKAGIHWTPVWSTSDYPEPKNHFPTDLKPTENLWDYQPTNPSDKWTPLAKSSAAAVAIFYNTVISFYTITLIFWMFYLYNSMHNPSTQYLVYLFPMSMILLCWFGLGFFMCGEHPD